MDNQKIKIKLKSFDHKVLERATSDVVSAVKRTGADVSGPIPLPRHIERFTVIRGPHVDKKSREQFEIRTQKRFVIINSPTTQTVEALREVELPAGVDVEIKVGAKDDSVKSTASRKVGNEKKVSAAAKTSKVVGVKK